MGIAYEKLPQQIKRLVLQRQFEHIGENDMEVLEQSGIMRAFNWSKSIEGHDFWSKIHKGDIDHFYTLYPKSSIKPEFESLYKKTFKCNKIIESEIDLERIRELGLEYILVE